MKVRSSERSDRRSSVGIVDTRRYRPWVPIALLALLVIVVGAGGSSAFEQAVREAGVRLAASGIVGAGWFVAIGIPAIAVGLPRQLFAFAAGLAWGFVPGLLAALLVALAGSTLAFECSRRRLASAAARRFPRVQKTVERVATVDGFRAVLALRLQPFGTNLMTNVAAGLTTLPRRHFVVASGIGFLPQTIVFVLVGDGLRIGSDMQMMVGILSGLLSVGLGALVLRRVLASVPARRVLSARPPVRRSARPRSGSRYV